MSPSYRVPLATDGGPKNGPSPVKVNTDFPVAAERTAMLLPSPAATTPPEVTVSPPSTKPSVKQCCQMTAPVAGFNAFIEPEQVPIASPPTYSVVPSKAADATSPVPVVGLPPPFAIRVLHTGPDEIASLLNA